MPYLGSASGETSPEPPQHFGQCLMKSLFPGSHKHFFCCSFLSLFGLAACGILIPQLESNPRPLHWKLRVLTTGPPGRSLRGSHFILWLLPDLPFSSDLGFHRPDTFQKFFLIKSWEAESLHSSLETITTLLIGYTLIQNKKLFKPKPGFCINIEGWDGEADGREVQKGGDMCIPMADSSWDLTENSKIL